MRFIFIGFIIIGSLIISYAQPTYIVPVKANNLWGAVDIAGKSIIPFIFNELDFTEKGNFIRVKQSYRYGLYSDQGEEILPVIFNHIHQINDSIFYTEINESKIFKNLNNYTSDTIKDEIIFNNEINYFTLNSDSIVFMNRKLNLIKKIKATSLGNCIFTLNGNFLQTLYKNKIGLIDMYGNVMVAPENSYIQVLTRESYKGIHIKKPYDGLKYDTLKFFVEPEFFMGVDSINFRIYSTKGELLNSLTAIRIKSYDSVLIVTDNLGSRLTTISGQQLGDLTFDDIQYLSPGYFIYKKNETQTSWGLLNNQGKIITPPLFYSIIPHYSGNFFHISDINKWGLINKHGEFLAEIKYKFENIQVLNYEQKVRIHFEGNDSMMVIILDNDYKILDKVMFKNYAILKQTNFQTKNYSWSKKYFANLNSMLYGVTLNERQIVVPYKFSVISEIPYLPNVYAAFLYETSLKYGYSIVNLNTGNEILTCVSSIFLSDLFNKDVIRVLHINKKISLISADGNVLVKECSYVDNSDSCFIRFAKSGKIETIENEKYCIEVPGFKRNWWQMNFKSKNKISVSASLWGLINKTGKTVLAPIYNFIEKPFNNMIIVCKSNKWGVLNYDCTMRIPLNFQEIKHFRNPENPEQWIDCEYLKACLSGKYGVIKTNGDIVVSFDYQDVQYISTLQGGNFLVKTENLWGVVDDSCNWIVKPQFHEIKYNCKTNTYIGVVHKTQHFILNTQNKAYSLPNDVIPVGVHGKFTKVKLNRKFNFVDSVGILVFNDFFHDIRYADRNLYWIKDKHNNWWAINNMQDTIIKNCFADVGPFSGDVAPVQLRRESFLYKINSINGYNWNFVDKNGKLQFLFLWKKTKSLRNNYAIVQTKRGWGVVDMKGKKSLKTKYAEVEFVSDDLVKIRTKKQKFGIYNLIQKKWILSPQFAQISNFADGVAAVKLHGNWGYIDTTYKVIIPHIYSKAEDFRFGYAVVKKNKVFFVINKNNCRVAGFRANSCKSSDSISCLVKLSPWSDYKIIGFNEKTIKPVINNTLLRSTDFQNNLAFVKSKSDSYLVYNFISRSKFYEEFKNIIPITTNRYVLQTFENKTFVADSNLTNHFNIKFNTINHINHNFCIGNVNRQYFAIKQNGEIYNKNFVEINEYPNGIIKLISPDDVEFYIPQK